MTNPHIKNNNDSNRLATPPPGVPMDAPPALAAAQAPAIVDKTLHGKYFYQSNCLFLLPRTLGNGIVETWPTCLKRSRGILLTGRRLTASALRMTLVFLLFVSFHWNRCIVPLTSSLITVISPEFTQGVVRLLELENVEQRERFIKYPDDDARAGIDDKVDKGIETVKCLLKAWVVSSTPEDARILVIVKSATDKVLEYAKIPVSPRGAQMIESFFASDVDTALKLKSTEQQVDDNIHSSAQAAANVRKTNRALTNTGISFQTMPHLNAENEALKQFVKQVKAIQNYSPVGEEEIDNGKKHVKKALGKIVPALF